jgi:hypothetical protein
MWPPLGSLHVPRQGAGTVTVAYDLCARAGGRGLLSGWLGRTSGGQDRHVPRHVDAVADVAQGCVRPWLEPGGGWGVNTGGGVGTGTAEAEAREGAAQRLVQAAAPPARVDAVGPQQLLVVPERAGHRLLPREARRDSRGHAAAAAAAAY